MPTGARGELCALPPLLCGFLRRRDSPPVSDARRTPPAMPGYVLLLGRSATDPSDALPVWLGDSGITGEGGRLESENREALGGEDCFGKPPRGPPMSGDGCTPSPPINGDGCSDPRPISGDGCMPLLPSAWLGPLPGRSALGDGVRERNSSGTRAPSPPAAAPAPAAAAADGEDCRPPSPVSEVAVSKLPSPVRLPFGVGVGVDRSFTYSRTSFARSLRALLLGLDPVLSPVGPAAAAAAEGPAAGAASPGL